MIQTYAYQILSDRADSKLYYETSRKDKTLQFVKTQSDQWDMYYKGIHVAYITPGTVHMSYEVTDEITIRSAFDLLQHFVLDTMVSDEAYQLVTFTDI